MTETLHFRLLAYFAKLGPRKDTKDVIQDIGVTMAKEIDKLTARVDALESSVRKSEGEKNV